MPFNHYNLKNILFDIGVSHSIFQENFLHYFFCDNLIWYQLDDFDKWLITSKKKGFLFKSLDANGSLGICPLPCSDHRRQHFSIFSHQRPIFKNLLNLKLSQMVNTDHISPITWSNGSKVIQSEIFCGIQCCHLNRQNRIHPPFDSLPDHGIDMALFEEFFWMAVIGYKEESS